MRKNTVKVFCTCIVLAFLVIPYKLKAQNTVWPATGATSSVGIGTTSPVAKLSVASTTGNDGIDVANSAGAATLGLTGSGGHLWKLWSTGTSNTGGAGHLQLVDHTGSGSARLGFIFSASTGNFGLGNLSTTNLPTAQFHTTGTVRFQGLATDNNMTEAVVVDANGNLAKRAYAATTLSCSTVNYIPKVTGTGVLNCSQLVDNGTNIGIGISSPATKLSIASAAANDGIEVTNSAGAATLSLTGTGGHNWRLWSTGTTNTGGAGHLQLVDQTGDGSTSRLGFIFSNTGNFGLGSLSTTNLPTAQLHTTGTVRFAGLASNTAMNEVVVLDANGNLGKRNYYSPTDIVACSTANYIPKVTGTGVLNCSQLVDNGTNIGIGISSPATKLSIASSAANDGIEVTNSAGAATLSLTGTGGHTWRLWSLGTTNTGGAGHLQLVDMTGDGSTSRLGFIFSNTGNFGLGNLSTTNLPTAQFHTTGSVRFAGLETNNTMTEAVVIDANGNLAKRVYANDINQWRMGGNNNASSTSFIGTTNAQPLVLKTNNISAMHILANGKVGIGDSIVPADYKLAVNGKLIATEIAVKLRNKWGDFVFAPEFKLMNLSEVEAYVKKNSHLPGVPSASEIETKGLEVGEMENILMQKVEQLTLYAIDQDKTIAAQKQKDTDQQAKIDQLLKLLEEQNKRIEKLENK